MPRHSSRPRVPRINLDVVRRAFRSLPGKGESDNAAPDWTLGGGIAGTMAKDDRRTYKVR